MFNINFDINGRYGNYLPDLIPGSHSGYNELQRIATGVAMERHRKLIARLTEPCRMVTDGSNMVWLPDLATMKSDGFSSGIKSMEPQVFKVFLSAKSWYCTHELLRLVPSYGCFEFNGETLERGKNR